jgi:hypothetical protein
LSSRFCIQWRDIMSSHGFSTKMYFCKTVPFHKPTRTLHDRLIPNSHGSYDPYIPGDLLCKINSVGKRNSFAFFAFKSVLMSVSLGNLFSIQRHIVIYWSSNSMFLGLFTWLVFLHYWCWDRVINCWDGGYSGWPSVHSLVEKIWYCTRNILNYWKVIVLIFERVYKDADWHLTNS